MQLLSVPVPGKRDGERWERNEGRAFNQTVQICFMLSEGDEKRERGAELKCEKQGSVRRGIIWRCASLLPAALPSLTCSAERGMSRRNLNGSESP